MEVPIISWYNLYRHICRFKGRKSSVKLFTEILKYFRLKDSIHSMNSLDSKRKLSFVFWFHQVSSQKLLVQVYFKRGGSTCLGKSNNLYNIHSYHCSWRHVFLLGKSVASSTSYHPRLATLAAPIGSKQGCRELTKLRNANDENVTYGPSQTNQDRTFMGVANNCLVPHGWSQGC